MLVSYKAYDTYQCDLFLLVFTAPFETLKGQLSLISIEDMWQHQGCLWLVSLYLVCTYDLHHIFYLFLLILTVIENKL